MDGYRTGGGSIGAGKEIKIGIRDSQVIDVLGDNAIYVDRSGRRVRYTLYATLGNTTFVDDNDVESGIAVCDALTNLNAEAKLWERAHIVYRFSPRAGVRSLFLCLVMRDERSYSFGISSIEAREDTNIGN